MNCPRGFRCGSGGQILNTQLILKDFFLQEGAKPVNFVKIQGTGNDFIVLDNYNQDYSVEYLQSIVSQICQRRISIGADGVLIVLPPASDNEDFSMIYMNQDGSLGEMCGNGARCIARYAFEKGYAGASMTIGTTAGRVSAWRLSKRIYKIMMNNPAVLEPDHQLTIKDRKLECSYVELGNPGVPHAVVYCPGLADMAYDEMVMLASEVRNDKSFPKGANCNLYDIIEKNRLLVKTYERGVEDFTLSCGTGSGSVGVTAAIKGICEPDCIEINVPGGKLQVCIKMGTEKQIEELYLTGPTTIVAEGLIADENLDMMQKQEE